MKTRNIRHSIFTAFSTFLLICGSAAHAAVTDYLTEVEIFQGIDFGTSSGNTDDYYSICIDAVTSTDVTQIQVVCPGGRTLTIANGQSYNSGESAEYYDSEGEREWEFEGYYDTATSLDQFGDGNYTFTVTHSGGTASTAIPYKNSDSSNLSQPFTTASSPFLTSPTEGGNVSSGDVTLQWSASNNTSADYILTEIVKGDNTSEAENEFMYSDYSAEWNTLSSSTFSSSLLSEGPWEAEFLIADTEIGTTAEGVNYIVIKGAISLTNFTYGNVATISGSVAWSGSERGTLYVSVIDYATINSNWTLVQTDQVDASSNPPWSWSAVIPQGDYALFAFLDTNANQSPDNGTDPSVYYGGETPQQITVTGDQNGLDMTLPNSESSGSISFRGDLSIYGDGTDPNLNSYTPPGGSTLYYAGTLGNNAAFMGGGLDEYVEGFYGFGCVTAQESTDLSETSLPAGTRLKLVFDKDASVNINFIAMVGQNPKLTVNSTQFILEAETVNPVQSASGDPGSMFGFLLCTDTSRTGGIDGHASIF